MTVCIAATCSNDDGRAGSAVVVASDRMVTMANLIEFEHTAPKSTPLGARAVALIAGDALTGTHLVREVAAEVAAAPMMTVAALAQALSQKYVETRTRHAEADILVPRALTLQSFYGQHQQLIAQLTLMLDKALTDYNMNVELLVAGVDDAGGHIAVLVNPGSRALDQDVIGYGAVGSGALHAVQSMIGFRHATDCPLGETIFRVYASKRRAEVAPGVGNETDMYVIRPDGITTLPAETIEELNTLYADFQAQTERTLQERLRSLSVGSPEEDKK